MRITKENSSNSFKIFFLLITFPLSMDLYLDLKVTSFLLLYNRPGVELISLLLQSRPGLKLILNLHTLNPSYTPLHNHLYVHPNTPLQLDCSRCVKNRFATVAITVSVWRSIHREVYCPTVGGGGGEKGAGENAPQVSQC